MSLRSRVVFGVGLAAVLVGLALAILEPAPLSPGDSRALTVLAGIAMFLAIGYRVWRGRRWRAGADRSTGHAGGDGEDDGGPDADGPDGGEQNGGGPGGDGRNSEGPSSEGSGGTERGEHGPSGQGPPRPWTSAGVLLERAPERTPTDRPLAGDSLARLTTDAARVAREDGSVEAGLAIVRPRLRAATRDVLAAGGGSAEEAGTSLDAGEWTDDPVAASVLSDAVTPPPTSLRDRIRAWLFPETVVRRRIGRTVAAIGVLAESRLPILPGQEVPRTRSVAPPRLEALEVGPDGSQRRGSGSPQWGPSPRWGAGPSTAEFREGEGRPGAPSTGTDQGQEDP